MLLRWMVMVWCGINQRARTFVTEDYELLWFNFLWGGSGGLGKQMSLPLTWFMSHLALNSSRYIFP